MDVAKLGQREKLAARPCARVQRLTIDPVSGIGISTNLHVLPELLVAHRSAFLKELLDLLEHERVALDRGRVVSLLKPYPMPDPVCFARRRQTTEPLTQFADLNTQTLIDGSSRRPTTTAPRDFVRLRHYPIVPNTSQNVRLTPN